MCNPVLRCTATCISRGPPLPFSLSCVHGDSISELPMFQEELYECLYVCSPRALETKTVKCLGFTICNLGESVKCEREASLSAGLLRFWISFLSPRGCAWVMGVIIGSSPWILFACSKHRFLILHSIPNSPPIVSVKHHCPTTY